MIGNRLFIGISQRTNQQGAAQLGQILRRYGKTCTTIPAGAALHFKSAVNYVGQNTLIVTPDFAEHAALKVYDSIVVDPKESYAANTLWVNDHLLMPEGFPGTKMKLEERGLPVIELDVSEMQKMDGGLTCLSLRF